MSNIYSQFPKEPKSPDNDVATPRVDELDYNQEIKSYRIWDLSRELERELAEKTNEVARLRELLNRALECLKVYGGRLGIEAVKQISEELATAPEEPTKN